MFSQVSLVQKIITKIVPPLVFLILFLLIFEILCRAQLIPNYLLPSPSAVFQTFYETPTELFQGFFATTLSTLQGLVISAILGIALAFVFNLNSLLERAILPFCVFFQTVPIVAIAPLLVIWFGFGAPTVIASASLVSFFPILAGTLSGLNAYSRKHEQLFQIYKARPWQILLWLKLPSSIPHMLSGMKIACGLSVIGAVVGEFVAGGGLGGIVDSAKSQQKLDVVFAAVLLSSLLGLILISFVNLTEHFLKNYTRSE